jgi:hypothetical protein
MYKIHDILHMLSNVYINGNKHKLSAINKLNLHILLLLLHLQLLSLLMQLDLIISTYSHLKAI